MYAPVKPQTLMTNNKTSYNNTKYTPVKPQTVMTDNKTSYNNTNYTPVKPQPVIVDNKPVTTIRTIPLPNLKQS